MTNERVKFYSINDIVVSHHLQRIEDIIQSYDKNINKDYDINDILEFNNVILYFESGCYLGSGSEENVICYKEILAKDVGQFFSKINNQNIYNYFNMMWKRCQIYFVRE